MRGEPMLHHTVDTRVPLPLRHPGLELAPQPLAQQIAEALLEPRAAAALEIAVALEMLEVLLERLDHLVHTLPERSGGEQHRRHPVAGGRPQLERRLDRE